MDCLHFSTRPVRVGTENRLVCKGCVIATPPAVSLSL